MLGLKETNKSLCSFNMRIRTYAAVPRGRLRGRVGGESQPRPKPHPITSPDRPGPLLFLRACNIEKSGVAWGRGYTKYTKISRYTVVIFTPLASTEN